MLVLAGLSSGFAAWTKNEGLLFVIVVLVTYLVAKARRERWRAYTRDVLKLSYGLVPVLTLVLGFKLLLAPPSYLQGKGAIQRVTSIDRYARITSAFATGIMQFGDATGGVNPVIVIALYLLFHTSSTRAARYTSVHLLLVPILMLTGYFIV